MGQRLPHQGSGRRREPTTAKRRERGAGSIYEDAKRPGRYGGEVTIAGRRRRVSGPSKSAVRAKLDDLRAGGVPSNRQVTVAQALHDWLDRALPDRRVAASTAERHCYSADLIRDEIGKTRLAALDVRGVEAMLDRLGNRKVRPLSWATQK